MTGNETANEIAQEAQRSIADDWFEQETNSQISVPEFEALCERVFKQNALVKEMESAVDEQKAVLTKMKQKLMALMEEFGKTKYASNNGTLYTKDEFSVKVPKDPENKEKFLNWLKEKGIFDSMITVNSRSLVSLYNQELEASGNPDFTIPGITEVTSFKSLTIRKA